MINKSVTDTFLVPVPFGKSGIVLFQVFQRKDGVWTKIKFDNEDGQCQSADGLVEPGQTDSRYLQPINMDFDEVVDGEYYIEGIYRKTCVGENTIMHTNKVFFQVKN